MDLEILNTGSIVRTGDVWNRRHLPLKAQSGDGDLLTSISYWWDGRSIPASRSGIRNLLFETGMATTRPLLVKSMGLSLSDQYWIRPSGSDVSWESVNFFDNPFSEDVGKLLFGSNPKNPDLSSPDNTSDGVIRKRWVISEGQRCLIKSGSSPYQQEPFNEAIASTLMKALDIPHVTYSTILDQGLPCSICPDMVDRNTELISASDVMGAYGSELDLSPYDEYVECCRMLGIDIAPSLDGMILIDYIMLNEDRHTGNFGLIRDADTLEWIGPAPIYDTGTSLLCSHRTDRIDTRVEPRCRPFADSFPKEIGMVKEPERFDPGKAADALPRVRSILDMGLEWLGEDRIDRLMAVLEHRIGKAGEFADWNKG